MSVHLARLRLSGFRNLADQTVEIPPGGFLLIGDNGQGKTNLLESIYYLEIFRSFRGAPDEQLLRFGAEVFRVEGELRGEGEGERSVAAAFEKKRRRKKVTVGGSEPERLADAIGQVGAVLFSPSDVEIIGGSPAGRRRFLDIVLSLARPGYLRAIQRYRQVLAQRNTLLRRGAAAAQVSAWDAELVEWGSRVVAARLEWVDDVAASYREHYTRVSGGAAGELAYLPSLRGVAGSARGASVVLESGSTDRDRDTGGDGGAPPVGAASAAVEPSRATLAETYRAQLERAAERERVRGMTLVGPHRDDLAFLLAPPGRDPLDLRAFGSGGQQRTAAVALRMVEAETVHLTRGRPAIILLDDVFAELDEGRTARILEWIEREGAEQVVVTSPKPSDVAIRGGVLPRMAMRAGRVESL